MKVIFLDIDGVMNNINHAEELRLSRKDKETPLDWDLPYEGTIKPLKRIIDSTGAIVVLSSTWRYRRIPMLNRIFEPYGFQIADKTCNGVLLSKLEECGFDTKQCYDAKYRDFDINSHYTTHTYDRGAEIAWWLHEHPEVESFVIIDDDCEDIVNYYEDNFVKTDFYNWGLTEELADKAIEILNKEV